MQLISGLVSNNAAKVRMVLAEKGIEYETVEVPWSRASAWEPKPDILLRANPRAQVPVLLDGDLTLWDSTVINEYLEEAYPSQPLLPTQPRHRAVCRLWEDEGDFCQAHVGVLIQEVFLAKADASPSAAAAQAMAEMTAFYQRLESQLEGQEYIAGEFSLADVSVFLTVAFAATMGAQVTQPGVSAWYERMLSRPAIKLEFENIMAGVAAL